MGSKNSVSYTHIATLEIWCHLHPKMTNFKKKLKKHFEGQILGQGQIDQPKTHTPIPIQPVGGSIIIVKISTLLSTLHLLSIYAEKIQMPSPHQIYQPQIFGLCPYSPNLK